MGCTNSGMVHEGATSLVNNAKDLADKGENLVHDIEETAKETMDSMQNKIKEIAHKTGDNIESAVQNLSDKLTMNRNDDENGQQEQMTSDIIDDQIKTAEELSESETIPITETYEEAEMKVMEISEMDLMNDEHTNMMNSPENIINDEQINMMNSTENIIEINDNVSIHSKKSNDYMNGEEIKDTLENIIKEAENMKSDNMMTVKKDTIEDPIDT